MKKPLLIIILSRIIIFISQPDANALNDELFINRSNCLNGKLENGKAIKEKQFFWWHPLTCFYICQFENILHVVGDLHTL